MMEEEKKKMNRRGEDADFKQSCIKSDSPKHMCTKRLYHGVRSPSTSVFLPCNNWKERGAVNSEPRDRRELPRSRSSLSLSRGSRPVEVPGYKLSGKHVCVSCWLSQSSHPLPAPPSLWVYVLGLWVLLPRKTNVRLAQWSARWPFSPDRKVQCEMRGRTLHSSPESGRSGCQRTWVRIPDRTSLFAFFLLPLFFPSAACFLFARDASHLLMFYVSPALPCVMPSTLMAC